MSFSFPFSSCDHVLQDIYTHTDTTESTEREGTREKGEKKKEGRRGGGSKSEDVVPTREAHRASVPSLQLRALIRLIVSNIETHNKHNTWRPFAILISSSQLARTTRLEPSEISLI